METLTISSQERLRGMKIQVEHIIDWVREEFPNPVASDAEGWDSKNGSYCVLIAMHRYALAHAIKTERETVLEWFNPFMTDKASYDFATEIMNYNDIGQFDEAWERARAAIDWRPE